MLVGVATATSIPAAQVGAAASPASFCTIDPGLLSRFERDIQSRVCRTGIDAPIGFDESPENRATAFLDSMSWTQQHADERVAEPAYYHHAGGLLTLCADREHPAVSARFVTALLTDYDDTAIALSDLLVSDHLSLADRHFQAALSFRRVVFCDGVSLKGARFDKTLGLEQIAVLAASDTLALGVLDLREVRAQQLSVKRALAGVIDARLARVSANANFALNVTGHMTFAGIEVERDLSLANVRQYGGPFQSVMPTLNRGYHIYGNYLDLIDARIGRELALDWAHIDGDLSLFNAQIGFAHIRWARISAIDFRDAHIRGFLKVRDSVLGVAGANTTSDCDPKAIVPGEINGLHAQGLRVDGPVQFRDAETGARVVVNETLCLNNAKFARDLVLTDARLYGVNLEHARVDGRLVLTEPGRRIAWVSSGPGSAAPTVLDMRFAHIATLQSCFGGDWPARRLLLGAKVASLRFERCDDTPGPLQDRVVAVLQRADFDHEKMAPYGVFEQTFRAAGDERAATWIAIAAEERLTRNSTGLDYLGRTIKKYFGGYGIDPLLPMRTLLAFVVLGTLVAIRSPESMRFLASRHPASRLADPGRSRHRAWQRIALVIDGVVFSLDRLVPVVSIAPQHQAVRFDNSPGARWYFYLHALAGWVLAAMLPLFVARVFGA